MRFKIDWASLIVGRKFTVFALFYFVFEGNFQVQAPGGVIFQWRGDLAKGFCLTSLRGLFSRFGYSKTIEPANTEMSDVLIGFVRTLSEKDALLMKVGQSNELKLNITAVNSEQQS